MLVESLPRLRAPDESRDALTRTKERLYLLQNVLRQLRGLARSGAALEDDHLRFAHRIDDLSSVAVDRQRLASLLHDR